MIRNVSGKIFSTLCKQATNDSMHLIILETRYYIGCRTAILMREDLDACGTDDFE